MTSEIRTRIIGTGSYFGEGVLTNHELEQRLDTTNDWIIERTGIRERRIASKDLASSDMATSALRKALKAAGKQGEDLDMIICATISPDNPTPATATHIQRKLGLNNNCAAFDISAACAGFIYGLSLADSFILTKKAKTIGVVGVEFLSKVVDPNDRNTVILFGDAAGAVIVTPDTGNHGILSTHLYSDGSLADILEIPAGGSKKPASEETVARREHFLTMSGREVFRHAVRNMGDASLEALKANNCSTDDVDVVVAHQANLRIVTFLSKMLGIPIEKFIVNIDRFGNTSSASCPLALDEGVRENRIKENDMVLMTALGAGLCWGSALIRW
ncbi:MAG: ketoacyl-ACP synthase III [Proteobacteria bacterium]|nr:ketoacyl-ACP synthase III [Pseudomonadota bacterium]